MAAVTDPHFDAEVLYESDDDDDRYDYEREDLLGAGTNFRWRIHITSADSRRLFFSGPPIKLKFNSSRVPLTIYDFRRCITDACPDGVGKAFRVRSTVWPTSAFASFPGPFLRDKWFEPRSEGETSGTERRDEEEYWKLLGGCANYSRLKPKAMVVFDIDVHFLKKGKKAPR